MQARLYVLAHGGDPDRLTVEELRGIALMLSDGLIGAKATGMALGSIGSAIYTYLGNKTTVEEMIPSLYHYIRPPKTDAEKEETMAQKLIAFAMTGGPR